MTKKQHGTASLDAKQFAELAAAVIRQLPRDLESTAAQRWIENQGELQCALRSALVKCQSEHVSSMPLGTNVGRRYKITVGGMTGVEYKAALKKQNIHVDVDAEFLLNSVDFEANRQREARETTFICITVDDLFAYNLPKGYATTDEVFARAGELDLDLCFPDTGPALRLQDNDSSWKAIAMQPIVDQNGYPSVFELRKGGGRLELSTLRAKPDDEWDPGRELVFSLRK